MTGNSFGVGSMFPWRGAQTIEKVCGTIEDCHEKLFSGNVYRLSLQLAHTMTKLYRFSLKILGRQYAHIKDIVKYISP